MAVKINENRGTQQEICFKRNCSVSTGISNLGVWCKKWSNWTSGVGQKKRLRLPVLLGIRLQPKTCGSLRLRNPDYAYEVLYSGK